MNRFAGMYCCCINPLVPTSSVNWCRRTNCSTLSPHSTPSSHITGLFPSDVIRTKGDSVCYLDLVHFKQCQEARGSVIISQQTRPSIKWEFHQKTQHISPSFMSLLIRMASHLIVIITVSFCTHKTFIRL